MTSSHFVVPPSGVRVFIGFRHPDLAADRFQRELGQTFMPGTPYMLQPLGLAAYLPATFSEIAGRGLPQEVALIVWPSQPIQRQATRETLRGRVYTQSHGGVYSPASAATFPIEVAKFDPAIVGSFYLFDAATDWQSGAYYVLGATKRDPSLGASTFRSRVRDTLVASRSALIAAGYDQCIASLHDEFVVIWAHSSDAGATSPTYLGLETLVIADENLTGVRIICRAEPPNVPIVGSTAFNFVFQRAPEFFL